MATHELFPSWLGSRGARERDAVRAGGFQLCCFDRRWAGHVASWITCPQELFWVAPRTRSPLTPEKVIAWSADRDYPRVVTEHPVVAPLAYGELHYMPGSRSHVWLGHLLVAPACRGRGVGQVLTRLLLAEAFERLRARRASLVVFPDNVAAIHCYVRAGMIYAGDQTRFFETTGRYHRMLAFSMDRAGYRAARTT